MSYGLEFGQYRDRPFAFLRDNAPDYSDASYLADRWPATFEIPLYFASGYDDEDSVGRSNHRVWKDEHDKLEGKNWWDLGSSGILVRLDLLTAEQKDQLAGLEGYPLLSDDDHSELEMEDQDEAWADWGRDDFKREMLEMAEEDEHDLLEALLEKWGDAGFDTIYYDAAREADRYPEGSGGDIRFPGPEDVFAHIEKSGSGMWKRTPWDGTIDDLLDIVGQDNNLIVKLSDAAFCRVHPDDETQRRQGADYLKYDQVLTLAIGAIPDVPGRCTIHEDCKALEELAEACYQEQLDSLLKPFADPVIFRHIFEEPPPIELPYSKALMQSPYLKVEFKNILSQQHFAVFGYSGDEVAGEKQEKLARERVAVRDHLRGHMDEDPPSDLIEEVALEILAHGGGDWLPWALAQAKLREFEKIPYCAGLRQEGLPGVSERKKRHARR